MDQPRKTRAVGEASKPENLSQIQQPPSTNPSSSIPSSPTPPAPSLSPNPSPPQYTRPVTSPPSYSRPWHRTLTSPQHRRHCYLPHQLPPHLRRLRLLLGSKEAVWRLTFQLPSQPPPSRFPGSSGQQYGGSCRGTVGMSEAASHTRCYNFVFILNLQGNSLNETVIYWFSWRPIYCDFTDSATTSVSRATSTIAISAAVFTSHTSTGPCPSAGKSEREIGSSPEVEAILADIAEDFVESLTTDIHKERIAAIKKSVTVMEAANARNPYRHGMANARGGQAKTPANPLGSTTFNH
ncbi:hypothetical protein F2Q69_00038878 [Brassica cretica]|uniref:Uncharacterized protein n=1 Tax=Brassica cretica TaxID=69181 RepID=A0A8S9SQL2_BRACR|nr:hypothetical protein F2Q69_00038878 [Brassica cretica]